MIILDIWFFDIKLGKIVGIQMFESMNALMHEFLNE